MPKNKEILAAIRDTAKLKTKDKTEKDKEARIKAMDAILKVDIANTEAFRTAVIDDNAAFWYAMDNNIAVPGWSLTGSSWRAIRSISVSTDPHKNDDFLSTKSGEGPSFKEIKQAVAEQRVKFALTDVDSEVLIGLLTTDFTDNGKKLREYLEQKQNSLGMKFNEMHGWSSANEDILTKAALDEIRIEAANQLLLKTLAKPGLTDPKLFDDLVQAHTAKDIGRIKAAANALIVAGGIDLHGAPPAAFTDALTVALSAEIVAEAEKNRDKLLDGAALTKFYGQKVQDRDILSLDPAALLSLGDAKVFLDRLLDTPYFNQLTTQEKDRIKNLKPAEEKKKIGEKAQKELCERFLQAKLLESAMTNPKAANIFNKDKTTIVAELKANVPGIDTVIDKAAIDDNNINSFKIALLKNRLTRMADLGHLQTLDKAIKLDDFKAKLVPLLGNDEAGHPVNLDFIKQDDLLGLRDVIRGRLGDLKRNERTTEFEAKVEELSRFGKDAHKALINVFKELPDKKQLEILKEPQKLLLVINATSEREIQSHWGKENKSGGVLVVDRLIAENVRAAEFSKIYNPAMARILMKLPYVTPDKVDAINQALLTHRGLDLSVDANYKTFIDSIFTACCGADFTNQVDFYAKFQLLHNNNALQGVLQQFTTDIKTQHRDNGPLLNALHGAAGTTRALNDAEKELVKVLLRVGAAIPGMDTVDNIQNVYKDKFQGSPSVHDFLDKLIPGNTGPDKALKEKISRELTPDVYIKLRGDYYDQVIAHGTTKEKQDLVDGLNNFLKGVQASKSTINEYKEHLKALTKDLETLPYLYSGANEPKAKKKAEKMLGDYKAFEKQCDTLIEHLEAAKRNLQVRLDHTPIPGPNGTSERTKLIKELTELHAKLKQEIKDIDEQLPYFHEVKKQISGKDGAIAKIEGIMSHKLTAMVETTNISYSVVSRDQIKTATFQKKPGATDVDLTSGESNLDTDSPTFKLADIPEKGKVRCVDMVHVKATPTSADPDKTTEYTGRIAIDYHSGTTPSVLSGKDVVTNTRPVKVQIVTAMKDKDYLAEQMMEAAKNLLKDWDGKSPIKLKGVHGKDPELAHLWTAVCVLGEHHPKFSRDKIQIVGTSSWRPDSQRNWRGYTDDSLYNKVYKGSAKGLVEGKVTEFKLLLDEKRRNEIDKGLSKATKLWKDKLDEGKPLDITSTAQKDIAVQGTRQSRLTMGGGEDD